MNVVHKLVKHVTLINLDSKFARNVFRTQQISINKANAAKQIVQNAFKINVLSVKFVYYNYYYYK